jgi:hypothetical protein
VHQDEFTKPNIMQVTVIAASMDGMQACGTSTFRRFYRDLGWRDDSRVGLPRPLFYFPITGNRAAPRRKFFGGDRRAAFSSALPWPPRAAKGLCEQYPCSPFSSMSGARSCRTLPLF